MQSNTAIIKQVGSNGQISLGKEYAGKQVQICQLDDGTLIIKTGKFIPDNEQWLYADSSMERLNNAIEWAEKNPRRDNFQEIVDAIEND